MIMWPLITMILGVLVIAGAWAVFVGYQAHKEQGRKSH
jgi:hypothetical protein